MQHGQKGAREGGEGGDGAGEKWELRNKKRLVMKPKHHSKATAKAARTAYAPRRVDGEGGGEKSARGEGHELR